jgi:predicted O-methyltransferase YrrM
MKTLVKQILPSFVQNGLRRMKNAVASPATIQKYLNRVGYTVALRADYYSPLTSVSDLRSTFERWNRPSGLKGIEYDLDHMKSAISDLLRRYLREFSEIPPYKQLQRVGYGPGYTAVDALMLYMMIRHIRPKRYIEVGSGLSTYYCSLAAARNTSEGYPLAITCIEPYPFEKLRTIPNIDIIAKQVQDVEVSFFGQLQKDDVLFIDSSHVLKIDGDVPFLYLEVLPTLNVGVIVHIHDVPFPYNIPYPPQLWVFSQEWPMLWNEAMVVQAFLSFNRNFRVLMSTPLIRYFDEDFLRKSIPIYESIEQNPNTFSSLWLRRVS